MSTKEVSISDSKPVFVLTDEYLEILGYRFHIANDCTKNAIMGCGTIENIVPLNVIMMKPAFALRLKKRYHKASGNCSGSGCSTCWQMKRDKEWIEWREEKNRGEF
jgi:hypothetical protein